jgi:hypothetical protein
MKLITLLPFGLYVVAVFVVIPAILASKLHRLAPPGMSRFQCFGLVNVRGIGPTPMAPLGEGESREFRERLMTYRWIRFGMGFLLLPLMAGPLLILSRNLNP